MKKKLLFIFCILFFNNSFSNTISKLVDELRNNNFINYDIKKFYNLLKSNCSERLIINLKSHESYPNFGTEKSWKDICKKINDSSKYEKKFILENFKIKKLSDSIGLLTGYYEPEIKVSFRRDKFFKFPILKYNEKYKNIPRNIIENSFLSEDVLLWTNSKIELFFLQIQGSGIGILPNKKIIKIAYGGNNNTEYSSIGKLLKKNELSGKEINLFTIKKFLYENPIKVEKILNTNKRYIFFQIKNKGPKKEGPVGSYGVNLVENISMAIDRVYYPLGIPMLIKLVDKNLSIPALALDTGSAIKGVNRVDLFTGSGEKAENIAGTLKEKVLLYTLVPSK